MLQSDNLWRNANHSLLLLSLICLTSSAGCFGAGDRPDLGYVTGKITLDGQPFSDVRVVFKAVGVRSAYGATDENGDYYLVYLRDIKGAPVGDHAVRIFDLQKPEKVRGPGRIPIHYVDGKTPLAATVIPGEQEIDFALTSNQDAEL